MFMFVTYYPGHWDLLLVQEFPNFRIISAVWYSDISNLKYLLVPVIPLNRQHKNYLNYAFRIRIKLAKETAIKKSAAIFPLPAAMQELHPALGVFGQNLCTVP